MAGLTLVQNVSAGKAATKQANAVIDQTNLSAANKAKEVQARAARQQVSFLSSGLTLEGTPRNVIDATFDTGIEDINQIRANGNIQAKNIIGAARTAAIGRWMDFGSGIDFGTSAAPSGSSGSTWLGSRIASVSPTVANRLGYGWDAYNASEAFDMGA